MIRVLLLCAAMLGGCSTPPSHPESGERIVSIDYCADQMVLGLVDRRRIAAVSMEAAADPLFAGRLATGLPRVPADIERIVALRPTLVVRSYAGGTRLDAALQRAGIRVYTLPYVSTIAEARAATVAGGHMLNAQNAAAARIARFDRDVSITVSSGRPALYTTPGSYTAGSNTLIGEVIARGGYRNAEIRNGWHRLDVEQLVTAPPALVIRAFGESNAHVTDRWTSSDHRALISSFQRSQQLNIPGSWVACGNWRIGHAVTAIRAVRP